MVRALIKIARDRGDPFAAREQVFRTRHPELTQAVDEALELLDKAGAGARLRKDRAWLSRALRSGKPVGCSAGPRIKLARKAKVQRQLILFAESSRREAPITIERAKAIRTALEAAGIEFTNGVAPGVRLRNNGG